VPSVGTVVVGTTGTVSSVIEVEIVWLSMETASSVRGYKTSVVAFTGSTVTFEAVSSGKTSSPVGGGSAANKSEASTTFSIVTMSVLSMKAGVGAGKGQLKMSSQSHLA
jgi:hypothetical protein